MRKLEEMAWYSVDGPDGFPRAMHAVKGKQPEKAKEISQAEAAQISKDVRAREPKPVAVPSAAGAAPVVDLTPIKNQLEAHSKMLVEQAREIDEHGKKIDATQASVSAYLIGIKSGVSA
jgi:hypothetical protein